jgi:hypothetical protein
MKESANSLFELQVWSLFLCYDLNVVFVIVHFSPNFVLDFVAAVL